ncbi:hypothetical protein PV703_15585 [Streptomyces sp. ME01-24h]|nr:hypothetical protein [Streptomyces sp. ME01-24h]
MSTSSQNPTSNSSLGPITPVRCPDAGCYWAAFGIPDKYGEARAWHLSAHRAEEHGESLSAKQIAFAKERGHRLPSSVTPDSRCSQTPSEPLSPEREAEIRAFEEDEHRNVLTMGRDLEDVLAEVDRLRAELAKVAEHCAARAEYIDAINNCAPSNEHDYWRWQGHAESRRQLSQTLGLPVGWPAGYEQDEDAKAVQS